MAKVFFIVERNMQCREVPAFYHDEIPASARSGIVWGCNIGDSDSAPTLNEMYEVYRSLKTDGLLPPSNLDDRDFYTRK